MRNKLCSSTVSHFNVVVEPSKIHSKVFFRMDRTRLSYLTDKDINKTTRYNMLAKYLTLQHENSMAWSPDISRKLYVREYSMHRKFFMFDTIDNLAFSSLNVLLQNNYLIRKPNKVITIKLQTTIPITLISYKFQNQNKYTSEI